jgi:hypothetical protein
MRVIILFLSLVFLMITSGCASYFKRKECEKTNWYNHGHKVAMAGKRLDADDFVSSCEKVEAKINYGDLDVGFKAGMATYCEPQAAYDVGRKGEFFNLNMCEDNKHRLLKAKHTAGVKDFCQPDSGFTAAAKGWKYNNICPKDLEKAFMIEYRKGRKRYLRTMIEQKRDEIRELNDHLVDLNRQKADAAVRLSRVPRTQTVTKKRRYDPQTRTMKEETQTTEDPKTAQLRRDIEWDINSLENQIRTTEKKKKQKRAEIRELKRELSTIR